MAFAASQHRKSKAELPVNPQFLPTLAKLNALGGFLTGKGGVFVYSIDGDKRFVMDMVNENIFIDDAAKGPLIVGFVQSQSTEFPMGTTEDPFGLGCDEGMKVLLHYAKSHALTPKGKEQAVQALNELKARQTK